LEPLRQYPPHTGMNPIINNLAHHAVLAHNAQQTATRNKAAANSAQQFQTTGKARFNQSAGVFGMLGRIKRSLSERLSGNRNAKGKQRASDKGSSGVSRRDELDDDDMSLSSYTSGFFENMRDDDEDTRGRRVEIEKKLEDDGRDPLQSYVFLQKALFDLDKQPDMSDEKKSSLKATLKEMLKDVYERNPQEIRKGLQAADELSNPVDAMSALSDKSATSVRELRFLYGAKGDAKQDTPLTPLTMLKALAKHFGSENVLSAVSELRSKMMTGLRSF
jgi:hypothetical protein